MNRNLKILLSIFLLGIVQVSFGQRLRSGSIMKRLLFLILLTFIFGISKGQEKMDQWINVHDSVYRGTKDIKLYYQYKDEKILVQDVELNKKGRIERETVYCDFLYEPLEKVSSTVYTYDSTDTLLINYCTLNEKHDTISGQVYSYAFNSKGQIIKKGILDIPDNIYDQEVYSYNDKGLVTEFKTEFCNQSEDTVFYYFLYKYEYDESSNLVKESFIDNSTLEQERIYTYDSLGRLRGYTTNGLSQCGEDIFKYLISYNDKALPVLKEYWNAGGVNWAFELIYDDAGRLIKKIRENRYPIKEEDETKNETRDTNIPPIPPFYTQDMLEKDYTPQIEQIFSYDKNSRIIKVVEKYLWLDYSWTFSIEYE